MKKLTVCVCAALLPIALGSLTEKPCGANSPRLSSCSLAPAPASSGLHLRAHPRIILDDSLRGQGKLYSSNWSGYGSTATPNAPDTVTTVTGTWTVPAVTSTAGNGQAAYSAIWVGIDGLDDGTVEQLGTMQAAEVVSQGYGRNAKTVTETAYYAWVEMYPAGMVELPGTVKPGDVITASVTCAEDVFTLTMTDSTEKWTYTTTATSAAPERMSAEWVVEAPAEEFGRFTEILPLAKFLTPVSFMGCSATIDSFLGPIDESGFTVDEVIMATANGTVKAQPSAITDTATTGLTTSSFTVTWGHD